MYVHTVGYGLIGGFLRYIVITTLAIATLTEKIFLTPIRVRGLYKPYHPENWLHGALPLLRLQQQPLLLRCYE